MSNSTTAYIFPNKPYMGGCQNYGPFLDPYYNTAPNISGTPKGTIILTTTHILLSDFGEQYRFRPSNAGGFGFEVRWVYMI